MTKQDTVRFNVIDALIIIFTLVLIALIVYIFVLGNDFADLYSEKAQISYTVCIPNTDLENVMVGDSVYHWNKDSAKGKITEIRIEKQGEETDSYAYITVSVTSRKIKSNYYIVGKKIEENSIINISFSRFDTSNPAKCILVEAN